MENIYNQIKDQYGDNIQKINDAIMESQFPEVQQVYIDLGIMKDTRIGTMVAYAPSKDDVTYLINHLEDYNRRLQRTFKYAFPEYPLGELELKMKWMDPSNSEHIFNHSPDTEFNIKIYEYMQILADQNARAGYSGDVNFIINTWPLEPTPFMRKWLKGIHAFTRGFNFSLINMEPQQIPREFWMRQQVLFVDDLIPLVDPKSGLYKPLFEEGVMRNTFVHAPYQLDQSLMDKIIENNTIQEEPEAIDTIFDLTTTVMTICCRFQYITFPIPTPRG